MSKNELQILKEKLSLKETQIENMNNLLIQEKDTKIISASNLGNIISDEHYEIDVMKRDMEAKVCDNLM